MRTILWTMLVLSQNTWHCELRVTRTSVRSFMCIFVSALSHHSKSIPDSSNTSGEWEIQTSDGNSISIKAESLPSRSSGLVHRMGASVMPSSSSRDRSSACRKLQKKLDVHVRNQRAPPPCHHQPSRCRFLCANVRNTLSALALLSWEMSSDTRAPVQAHTRSQTAVSHEHFSSPWSVTVDCGLHLHAAPKTWEGSWWKLGCTGPPEIKGETCLSRPMLLAKSTRNSIFFTTATSYHLLLPALPLVSPVLILNVQLQ